MPATINGCGTTYYGERNAHTRQGQCGSCQRNVMLRSYDTMLWFVVAFIPIIPLGKKRIIDYCPSCRRHHALSLAQWRHLQSESCARALAAYRESPKDSDKIRDAINAFVTFHHGAGLNEFAEELRKDQPGNVEALRHLGIAQEYLRQYTNAEDSLRLALRASSQDEATKEALAEVLIRLQRPEEAEPLLAHVRRSGDPKKAWLLMLLATGWQAKGEHQRALNALDQCKALVPQVEQQKDYRKARKLSEKYRDRTKPIASKAKALAADQSNDKADVSGRIALGVPIVLLLAGLIWFLLTAVYGGLHREVYLINGLSKPYDVTINDGERITLPAGRQTKVAVKEGDLNVKVISDQYDIPAFTTNVHTNFFERPFIKPVFLLNPDEVALYEYERATYMAKNPPPTVYTVYTSKRLNKFRKIDFPFQSLPQTVSVSKNGSETRTRIGMLNSRTDWSLSLEARLFLRQMRSQKDAEELVPLVLKRLALEPTRADLIRELDGRFADSDQMTNALRPLLDQRPILLEIHCYYQDWMRGFDRDEQVRAEYVKLLEENPNDASRQYLLARITGDPDKYHRLINESATADPPCAYSLVDLAWLNWQRGDFSSAFKYASKANELAPDTERCRVTYMEMCLATENYDAAARMQSGILRDDPEHLGALQSLAYCLAAADRKDEALKTTRMPINLIRRNVNEETADHLQALVSNIIEEAGMTPEQIIDRARQHPEEESVELPLWEGDFDKATQFIDEDSSGLNALFAVALHQQNRREEAAEYLESFLSDLSEDAEAMTFTGAILAGGDLTTEELLDQSYLGPLSKYALLVLGEYQPSHRKEAWELAHKLNYDRRDYYAITEKLIRTQ